MAGNASFSKTDSLMNVGQWQDARIELEKIAYFSNDKNKTTTALLKKAECFNQEHLFSESIKTLSRIFLFNQPDSIIFKTKYNKALAYYLNSESGNSIAELKSLNTYKFDSDKAAQINFLSALAYTELTNWKEAYYEATEFLSISIGNEQSLFYKKVQLDSLFSKKNIPNYLSEKKAKNISTFIPGGGQFYCGKIAEGLFSLGLHGSLLYFGISEFSAGYYFTGYTAGFGLLQRLYTGNLQRVQNLAKTINDKKEKQFVGELLDILSIEN